MSKTHRDEVPGRPGMWMHTHSGRQFFPLDPRPEDFTIEDLANGLASTVRYAGQGRIDRWYSVAEHCVHIANWLVGQGYPPQVGLVGLLHDAAEGLMHDLTRANKGAVGPAYKLLEKHFQTVIWLKYRLYSWSLAYEGLIDEVDSRIVPVEKAAITNHPGQEWASDALVPLDGITIRCWRPERAKDCWLGLYGWLCRDAGMEPNYD